MKLSHNSFVIERFYNNEKEKIVEIFYFHVNKIAEIWKSNQSAIYEKNHCHNYLRAIENWQLSMSIGCVLFDVVGIPFKSIKPNKIVIAKWMHLHLFQCDCKHARYLHWIGVVKVNNCFAPFGKQRHDDRCIAWIFRIFQKCFTGWVKNRNNSV